MILTYKILILALLITLTILLICNQCQEVVLNTWKGCVMNITESMLPKTETIRNGDKFGCHIGEQQYGGPYAEPDDFEMDVDLDADDDELEAMNRGYDIAINDLDGWYYYKYFSLKSLIKAYPAELARLRGEQLMLLQHAIEFAEHLSIDNWVPVDGKIKLSFPNDAKIRAELGV